MACNSGIGKTMLAERLRTVLPRLEPDASLEVTSIHSISKTLPPASPLLIEPPFCLPHHTSTRAAIVDGGSVVLSVDVGAKSRERRRGVVFPSF
jgi:magnesium chelatase family protein